MVTRTFCDRCGDQVEPDVGGDEKATVNLWRFWQGVQRWAWRDFELCWVCSQELFDWIGIEDKASPLPEPRPDPIEYTERTV